MLHRFPPPNAALRARRRTTKPMTRQEWGRLYGKAFPTWQAADAAYQRYRAILNRQQHERNTA